VLSTLHTYSNLNHNTGYAQHTFSLSPYAGQTIREVGSQRVDRLGRLPYGLTLHAAGSQPAHAGQPDHLPVGDVVVARLREPPELGARLGELGAVAAVVVGPVRLCALAQGKFRGIVRSELRVRVLEGARTDARRRIRQLCPATDRAVGGAQGEPGQQDGGNRGAAR
jgi:hypothetical protein